MLDSWAKTALMFEGDESAESELSIRYLKPNLFLNNIKCIIINNIIPTVPNFQHTVKTRQQASCRFLKIFKF